MKSFVCSNPAAGDWLKGDGELSELFHCGWSVLADMPRILAQCGFTQIAITPRSQWYRQQAHAELLRTIGPLREQLFAIQQDERLFRLAAMYWRAMLQLPLPQPPRPAGCLGRIRAVLASGANVQRHLRLVQRQPKRSQTYFLSEASRQKRPGETVFDLSSARDLPGVATKRGAG